MSSIPKIGQLICHLLNLSMFLVGSLFLLVPLAIINVLSSNITGDDDEDDKNEQTNVALLVTLTKMIGGIIIAYAINTSVFLKNVDADFTCRRTLASQSMLGLIILLLGMLEDTNIDQHRSMLFVGVGSFVILMGLVGLMASFFPLDSSRSCDVVQSATAGGGVSTAAGAGTDGDCTGADTRPDNTVPLLEGETEIEEQDIESSSAQNENIDNDNICDEPEFESRIKGTKRLIQLAGPHTFYLYAGCIALLIRLPFSLSIPHFVSETLGALARSNYAQAKQNIFLLFACGTVDAALDFWCVFLFGLTNLKMTRAVRIDTFRAILMQEMAFFDWTNTGDLASRLTSDCGNMGGDLTWFFRFSIESIVRIVSIVSYMLWRSPKLGACAISVVPLVGAINKRYGDWLNHNAIAVQNALAQANSVSQEAFSCIRTVIAFASEDHELRKYKEKINNHYDLNVQQLYAQGFYYMVISTFLINTVVQALLLYVGMALIQRGELQAEVLLAFMLYQGGLQNEVMNLFNSYTSLIKSSGAGDKVFDLLDRSIPPPGTGHESFNRGDDAAVVDTGSSSNSMEMGIQVRQLSFSYPTRPDQKVLQGLDMDIPAGKTVALVGKSGCGKSTIIGLLQRFYDPLSGCILVNGLDLKDIHLKLHRKKIGVVTQDPVLFSGSIRDNILYGKEDSSEQNVTDAAKLANAHEFILRFPDGYDTQVGERGMQLSGGQKQRIAIARAIISKPKLLLLDEATSALDTESEKLVQDALDHLLTSSNQMTTVVIAHRLQTVRNADNIFVLNEGCVLEQGSHGDLMKKNGIYCAMVKRAENGKLS